MEKKTNPKYQKTSKSALVTSVLSLGLCFAMLIGTTLAWFTDSVTSAGNIIKSGKLDVEMYYADGTEDPDSATWTDASQEAIFNYDKWEPGYTEVYHIKISNEGSLALKYQLNIVANGEVSDLADVIDVYYVDPAVQVDDRTKLTDENKLGTLTKVLAEISTTASGNLEAGASDTVTLALKMQESAGNDYQDRAIGSDFSVVLMATQLTKETDSFDDQYDNNDVAFVSTTAELQTALDSATDGDIIMLVPGVSYGTVYMGRPTKNNDTKMTCATGNTHENVSYSTTDAEEFKTHLDDGKWHYTPKYTTTLKNLTVIGAEGATIAGLVTTSGHAYGDVYDYVRDKDYDSGSAYYNTLNMENIVFSNVNFIGKIDINTSDATSVYDGVTFDGCTFTTGGKASTNGPAIRYYNEANNGNVKNIVVNNCTFTNCYQGVYVHHVNGITVKNSTFENTGHNAIGIQGHGGDVDLKNVVITGNIFKSIGDRVIRFNEIGADSNITIKNNTATVSGDKDGQVMKATSIANGVTTSISNNTWNGDVVNKELKDN